MNNNQKRSNFSGKLGFVLAAAGSAVGLGNMWRFPYLAAKHGGGIFLLVYLILAVTFGFGLMITEIAIGRKTGLSAIGAYKKLNSKFAFLGYLSAIVPIIILPYYCVIGGWVMKYFGVYVTGAGHEAAADGFFGSFVSQPGEPLLWFAVFLGLTAIIVLLGVDKGIEQVSKIMMPILVVLSIGIAIFSMTRPGAMEGVKYYLLPDFENFSVVTVLSAMGQLFYSMSLAMGIMITYGSYMKKDVNLESSVRHIEVFDTGIAFLAGLMIIPPLFASASTPEQLDGLLKSGPSLMFVSLPKVFDGMPGLTGDIIGSVFFLLVIFAALTSSISLMEAIVSIIHDKLHIGRKTCCFITLGISVLLGVPSSLGFGVLSFINPLGTAGGSILDFFDFISNNILMPIVALLTCILVGYVIKTKTISDEVELNGKFKGKKLFEVVVKYIAPVCIVAILVFSVLDVFVGLS